jgi:hypothetical protein
VLPPRAKANGAASEPTEPLPYLDMSSWDANPAPEREWAVENRIPMYQPHLTTGHGAIGKSLLELTRAVAHVLGKPLFRPCRSPALTDRVVPIARPILAASNGRSLMQAVRTQFGSPSS